MFSLAGLCNMIKLSEGFSLNKITNKSYQYLVFSTKSLKNWNSLYFAWYLNGVKIIPSNIYDILTPVGLAYWIRDDGGLCGKGFHLNSNAFTKMEVELLISVLKNKFGLTCTLHSRNRIYIHAKSMNELADLVGPYMHESPPGAEAERMATQGRAPPEDPEG